MVHRPQLRADGGEGRAGVLGGVVQDQDAVPGQGTKALHKGSLFFSLFFSYTQGTPEKARNPFSGKYTQTQRLAAFQADGLGCVLKPRFDLRPGWEVWQSQRISCTPLSPSTHLLSGLAEKV